MKYYKAKFRQDIQFDDPRKHKKILSDNDFNNLIKWITFYFENNLILPEIDQPISEINTNKGNVIYALKSFFKKEYRSSFYPKTLFELYKSCFIPYKDDKIKNFLKRSEPKYYKELIEKNK